eukprot:gnl/TRDRNA2_/TRDRNA2_30615_c0_seq1.p1 gnl/TRDRNA2_/TRDRNA2_30615_c0~~gnl/TRDRNA2_/TRDRNA2_30615_c0_seq1.p1  ORF type:complete len:204 (-),score=35.65 gnl/TRDRNA2_/TRDRNA2_30615_c0_seq1:43-654(-)
MARTIASCMLLVAAASATRVNEMGIITVKTDAESVEVKEELDVGSTAASGTESVEAKEECGTLTFTCLKSFHDLPFVDMPEGHAVSSHRLTPDLRKQLKPEHCLEHNIRTDLQQESTESDSDLQCSNFTVVAPAAGKKAKKRIAALNQALHQHCTSDQWKKFPQECISEFWTAIEPTPMFEQFRKVICGPNSETYIPCYIVGR